MTVFFVHSLLPGLYKHPIQKYLENGGVGVGVVVVIGRRVLEWVYLFERLLTSSWNKNKGLYYLHISKLRITEKSSRR